MGDIITLWLRDKLGILVNVHDEAFLKMVTNGQLIALLLRKYNVITEQQLESLDQTTDPQEVAKRVMLWLKSLDASLEEDARNCFTKTKLSSAVKLFYRLYLLLKGKDQLYFTTKQAITQKLRTQNTRFECVKVPEAVVDPSAVGPHPLSHPLQEYYHIIQWHRDRYNALLQRCKDARNTYIATLGLKEKKNVERQFKPVADTVSYNEANEDETFDTDSLYETYDELKEQEKKALEMDVANPDPKLADKIVNRLKHKYRQDQKEKAMKAQMETILVTKIWNETVKNQEQAIEMELSKKILKQSNYEKQMAAKVFEIREQKYVMAENRNMVQKEIQKKMDDAVLEFVFAKEKETGDERYRYYFERDRVLELHRRIYEEKLRLKMQRRRDFCEEIVADMVDVALREAEYRETYSDELPRKLKNDLASLFVEGKSIYDVIEDTEVIIDFAPMNELEEEILLEEIDRQNAIDIRTFKDYCEYMWPFEVDVHTPEFVEYLEDIRLGLNILGHIIFRLLLTKYPKPPTRQQPDIPNVATAVCISSVPDLTILPVLEKLLCDRMIKIIQMQEAINYCLAAYKDETAEEYPQSQFVEETQKALEDLKKKKGKEKNGTEKKRKTDPKPKGQKPKVKLNKKPETEADSIFNMPLFQDEMLQTPKIFPCDEPVLSPVAELGRLAYEVLNLGEPLSDQLLVKMFVEYLKTFKGHIFGWVLIDYPRTFQQAALLEEALTARAVPIAESETITQELETSDPLPITLSTPNNTSITPEANTRDAPDASNTILATTPSTEAKKVKPQLHARILGVLSSQKDLGKELKGAKVSFLDNEELEIIEEGYDEFIAQVEPERSPAKICETQEINVADFADLDVRTVEQNIVTEDKNTQFRVSVLLENPDVIPIEEDYDTYLTAFIKISQDAQNLSISPHVVEEDTSECLTPLDVFYQNQGCHYTLYYKVMDYAAIKHLGKLILGDYSIPPKSSVQLFGDAVLYVEADVIQQEKPVETREEKVGKKKEKKPKPEKVKPAAGGDDKKSEKDKGKKDKGKKEKEKKEKGDSKKGKKGKIAEDAEVAIERADKETQIPTPQIQSVIEFIEIPEPVAGTSDYIYCDLSIPDFFQVVLATIWENVEEIYVYDFRELFFRKRLLWKTVIPYMDFVKKYMRDYIARPDEKQIHVFNFQKLYNAIDEDMRDDDELKAELHCRIIEFREKLWEICDQRMREAEEERVNAIEQDWVAKQACELTNVYITAMQLEIDRCADTMQLLNDYYTAMVTKMPCQGDVLPKALLEQIYLTANMEFVNAQLYREFVGNMLKDVKCEYGDTPYHARIRSNLKVALDNANLYEDASKKEISKMEAYVQPGKKGGKAKPTKDGKGNKGEKKWPKFTDPEPDVKELGTKLIREWSAAAKGEKFRVTLRLNMLMSVFCEDIKDMFTCSIKTFHGLYNEIRERYENEMKSVEKCCGVLSRAVEEEMAIQAELVLKGDSFFVNPSVLLFEDRLPEGGDIVQEYLQPESFTIDQLMRISTILMDLAPKGIMPEQAFLFLLQDIIVHNAEDGERPMVPAIWKNLSYVTMNRLSYEFFGKVEMIDWRDFIIYNMCVSFPTEEELMSIRRQFRELDESAHEFVYDYQYNSVRFWFEKDFDLTNPLELCRLAKIKTLLFKIFRTDETTVNYTSLLLTFCKADTTAEGFAKALALSLGKLVCYQIDIGAGFVETLRERKMQQIQEELEFQMVEREKQDTVGEILESLVDYTVHECDSCNIEELKDEQKTTDTDPNQATTIADTLGYQSEFATESMQYLENLMGPYPIGACDEYEYQENLFYEDFSNVEIGYEAYRNPPKAYYLPFEVMMTVMMSAMPWHAISQNVGQRSFRQKLEEVYEELKNHEFDDTVLTHEFLNSVQFTNLMRDNFKFCIKNPRIIIKKLLDNL